MDHKTYFLVICIFCICDCFIFNEEDIVRARINSEVMRASSVIVREFKNKYNKFTGGFQDDLYIIRSLANDPINALRNYGEQKLHQRYLNLTYGNGQNISISTSQFTDLIKSISLNISNLINTLIEEKVKEKINSRFSALTYELININSKYEQYLMKLLQYNNLKMENITNFNIFPRIKRYASQINSKTNFNEEILNNISNTINKVPRDCAEAKTLGRKTGVTKIQVEGLEYDQHVWCDQDTEGGGWTVFLRRLPMGENQLDFKKTYEEYRKPFGEASTEYWLGLDALHHITSTYGHDYMLRAEVKRGDEEAFSEWNYFKVDDDLYRYKMHVRDFSDLSTAGDAMEYHSGMEFSAYDSDNDKASGGSCSAWSGQGGWWYNYCYYSNPTGIYPPSDITETTEADHFLEWRKWQGYYVYLTHHSLMIRPN